MEENNEDALLKEDEEGIPESGKNTAPSQCNELMALLASMNKTMAAMGESLLGKGATCSGKTQDPKMAESDKRKHERMNSDLEELFEMK